MACRNGFSEMALTVSTFPGFLSFYRLCTDVPPPLNPPQKKSGRESLSPIFLRGGGRLYTGHCPLCPRENPRDKGDAQKGGRSESSARDDKFSSAQPPHPPPLSRACLNFLFMSAYHVALAFMYIRANNVIHFLSL